MVSPLAPECDVFRAGSAEDTGASADTATPADTSSPTDTGPDPFADGTWYPDEDGDGFGNHEEPLESEAEPVGYVSNPCDCNDDPDNGGADDSPVAAEAWGDGRDNNCDGVIDDAESVVGSWSGTLNLTRIFSHNGGSLCSGTETLLVGEVAAEAFYGTAGVLLTGSFEAQVEEGQTANASCHTLPATSGDATFQLLLTTTAGTGTIDLDDVGASFGNMLCSGEGPITGQMTSPSSLEITVPTTGSCSFQGSVAGTLTLNRNFP